MTSETKQRIKEALTELALLVSVTVGFGGLLTLWYLAATLTHR